MSAISPIPKASCNENVRVIPAELGVGAESQAERVIEVWEQGRCPAPTREALWQIAARTPGVRVISALTGAGCRISGDDPGGAGRAGAGRDAAARLRPGRQRAWLFDHHPVTADRQTETGYEIAVRWTERDRSRYRMFRCRSRTRDPAGI